MLKSRLLQSTGLKNSVATCQALPSREIAKKRQSKNKKNKSLFLKGCYAVRSSYNVITPR